MIAVLAAGRLTPRSDLSPGRYAGLDGPALRRGLVMRSSSASFICLRTARASCIARLIFVSWVTSLKNRTTCTTRALPGKAVLQAPRALAKHVLAA